MTYYALGCEQWVVQDTQFVTLFNVWFGHTATEARLAIYLYHHHHHHYCLKEPP